VEVLVAAAVGVAGIVGVPLGRGSGIRVEVGCGAGMVKLQAATDTAKAAKIAIAQIILCKSLIVFIMELPSIYTLEKRLLLSIHGTV